MEDISKLLPNIAVSKQIIDNDLFEAKKRRPADYQEQALYDNTPAPQIHPPVNPLPPLDESQPDYDTLFLSEEEAMIREAEKRKMATAEQMKKARVPQSLQESFLNQPPMTGDHKQEYIPNQLTPEQIRQVNPNYNSGNSGRPQPVARPQGTSASTDQMRMIVREELERIFGKLLIESGSKQNLIESMNIQEGDEIKLIVNNKIYFANVHDSGKLKGLVKK